MSDLPGRRLHERHSQPPNGGSRQTPATRMAIAAPMQFKPRRAADHAFMDSATMKPSTSSISGLARMAAGMRSQAGAFQARLPPADDRTHHRTGRQRDGAHGGSLRVERGARRHADDQCGDDVTPDERMDAPHFKFFDEP